MNTQQIVLSLLFVTGVIQLNAMENNPITWEATQKNFQINWQLLTNTQQYQHYKQAERDYTRNKNNINKLILTLTRDLALYSQEGQNFIAWYNAVQNFNKKNNQFLRKRAESAPIRPYKNTIAPIGSNRL